MLEEIGFSVQPHERGYLIDTEAEHIPGAIKLLIAAGIDLYVIQPHRTTLEDQFLEMTGGGEIAQAHTK